MKVPKQRLPSKVKVPVVQVLTSTQGFCGTGSQVKNPGIRPESVRSPWSQWVRWVCGRVCAESVKESVGSMGPFGLDWLCHRDTKDERNFVEMVWLYGFHVMLS